MTHVSQRLAQYQMTLIPLVCVKNCHFLDSRKQADIFRQDLLHLYIEAQKSTQSANFKYWNCWCGSNRLELAAELIETTKNFYRYGLKKIHPNQVKKY